MPPKITLDMGECVDWPYLGGAANAMPAFVEPLNAMRIQMGGRLILRLFPRLRRISVAPLFSIFRLFSRCWIILEHLSLKSRRQ